LRTAQNRDGRRGALAVWTQGAPQIIATTFMSPATKLATELATKFPQAQLHSRKEDASALPPEQGNYVAKNVISRQNLPRQNCVPAEQLAT
jgi:hypothetical protein